MKGQGVWGGLGERHRVPELMDDPGLDPAEHARALQGLRRINAVSMTVPALYGPIRDLARRVAPARLRVLELASGGGDTAIALALRAAREGLNLEVVGSDFNEQAVRIATERARLRKAPVRFFVCDALSDAPLDAYDVVTCSLFLHHLSEQDVQAVLRRMMQTASRMVLVDDLIRSRLGYALAWAGCRVLSRSPVVHYDGPVSVAGAFTIEEFRELARCAGLGNCKVSRRWPERFLLTWERDAKLNTIG